MWSRRCKAEWCVKSSPSSEDRKPFELVCACTGCSSWTCLPTFSVTPVPTLCSHPCCLTATVSHCLSLFPRAMGMGLVPPSWFSYSAMAVLMAVPPLIQISTVSVFWVWVLKPFFFFFFSYFMCFLYIFTLKSYTYVLIYLQLTLKSLSYLTKARLCWFLILHFYP